MATYYVADFEATIHHNVSVDDISENRQAYPTRVWLAGLENIHDPADQTITYSISEFIEDLFKRESATVLMHNLKGYDSRFILQYLVEQGYYHQHREEEFAGWKTILGNRNSFTIYHAPGKVYNFYDSLNLVNGTIKTLGDMTGVVSKGEETPLVEHGTSLEQTLKADGTPWSWPEAIDYLKGDLGVLAEVCRQLNIPAALNAGIRTQATLAYCSVFTEDGNPVPPYDPDADFRALNICKDSARVTGVKKAPNPPSANTNPKTDFDPSNPRLKYQRNTKEMTELSNKMSRASYRGGVAVANPQHANKWLGKYTTIDVNSMYPYIYSTKPLPKYFQGIKTYKRNVEIHELKELADKFSIIKFKYLKATIKGDYIPTIKPRTDEEETKLFYNPDGRGAVNAIYSNTIDYPITLTSVDLNYLLDFYTIEEAHIQVAYIYARSNQLEELFNTHCQRWMVAKEQASIDHANGVPGANARRYYAKLMLNSPYGKLGQYIKQYPVERYCLTENGYSEQEAPSKTGGKKSADIVTAAFITAYGRDMLGRAVNTIGYSNVYYTDTDSITLKGHWDAGQLASAGLTIHPNQLGAWAIEDTGDDCKFIAPKTYAKERNGTIKYTMAGYANKDTIIPKDQFNAGMTITDKRTIRAHGGTLIATIQKTIADDRKIQFKERKQIKAHARQLAREIAKKYAA